jgi:hypothetical protein
VEYLLLEGRDEIAPIAVASIALTANCGRVLDQLGCYDAIEENTILTDRIKTWKDSTLVADNDFPLLGHKR